MSHERARRDSDAAVPHETEHRTKEAAPAGLASGAGASAEKEGPPQGGAEHAVDHAPEHPVAPSFDKLRGAALSTLWFSVEEPPKSDHEAA